MSPSELITVAPAATATLTRTLVDGIGAARYQSARIQANPAGGAINYAFAPGLTNGQHMNPAISSDNSYQLAAGVILEVRDYDQLVDLVFFNPGGSPVKLFVTYGV